MSVDKDVVGVMAAYLPVLRVCTALSREALSIISPVAGLIYLLNGEFSSDCLMSVLTLQSSLLKPVLFCIILLVISLKTL